MAGSLCLWQGMIMSKRNYGIDLLRLLLMYMVCILHVLGKGGVLASCEIGTEQYKVFWLLELLAYCAVDGFAFISGYTAINKKQNYSKIVDMWFQAFFYSFIVTLLLALTGFNDILDRKEIIATAFPVMNNTFWYFTAYFLLFFAIPVLNKFLFYVNENICKRALIVMIIMFCIIGLVSDKDPWKLQNGYCALWLMVVYCMGVLSKRIKLFEARKTSTLIFVWMFCVVFTWFMHAFMGVELMTSYVSPTILLSGSVLVVIFSRIVLKGTIISKLAPLSFGIYLFQLSPIIWNEIIQDAFVFVVSKNLFIAILYVLTIAFVLFCVGMLVECIRMNIVKFIRVPILSSKIVIVADKWLTKCCALIK